MFLINPYSVLPGFPQIAATNNGTDGGSGTSASVNLPTGITSGQLLTIVGAFSSSGPASIAATGWTAFSANSGSNQGLYKIADGSEGSTVTVSWSGSYTTMWWSCRITGAHASAAPEMTRAGGASGAIDPAILTPSWGTANTLWIATAKTQSAQTKYPTSWTANRYTAGTGNPYISICSREAAASSQNIAADDWTQTSNTVWSVMTIAVRPA